MMVISCSKMPITWRVGFEDDFDLMMAMKIMMLGWMTYCLQLCVCQMAIGNTRWGDLPSTKSASGTSWRNQILQLRPRFYLYSILELIFSSKLIFDVLSFDDNLDDTGPCHCICLCCSYLSLFQAVSLSLLLYL